MKRFLTCIHCDPLLYRHVQALVVKMLWGHGATGTFAFCNDTVTLVNSVGPLPPGLPLNGVRVPDEFANLIAHQVW